jgi:hypothetical protein
MRTQGVIARKVGGVMARKEKRGKKKKQTSKKKKKKKKKGQSGALVGFPAQALACETLGGRVHRSPRQDDNPRQQARVQVYM